MFMRGLLLAALTMFGCGDDERVGELQTELNQCQEELLLSQARIAALEDPPPADPSQGGLAEDEAAAAAAEAEPENDPDAPLVPLRTIVNRNSAGTSEVALVVRNRSDKRIDAFRFRTDLFNGFNEPIASDRYGARREQRTT